MILVVAATCRRIPEHLEALHRTQYVLSGAGVKSDCLLIAPGHVEPGSWMWKGGDFEQPGQTGWTIAAYNAFMLGSGHYGSGGEKADGLFRFVPSGFSHVLTVHYDGFAVRPESWTPEFLEYDYIGAPWPAWMVPDRTLAVGNGGFSLRSINYLRALTHKPGEPAMRHRHHGESEDVWACRTHRKYYESLGLLFAPIEIAARFSMEHPIEELPNATVEDAFGFHGSFFRKRAGA